jgi:hypothetical protein
MDKTGSIYLNLKTLTDRDGNKIVEVKKEIINIEGVPTPKAVINQRLYKVENGEFHQLNKKIVDDQLIDAKIAGHQAEIDALNIMKTDVAKALK